MKRCWLTIMLNDREGNPGSRLNNATSSEFPFCHFRAGTKTAMLRIAVPPWKARY